jgi:predicted metalloprotease with PDZ domain
MTFCYFILNKRVIVFSSGPFAIIIRKIRISMSLFMKKEIMAFRAGIIGLVFFITSVSLTFAQNAIRVSIDASEAAKNIVHVKETLAAKSGTFDLFYPKWIPGEHSPTGTINDVVNLYFLGDGKPLKWRRDDVEMFAFHVTVPPGTKQIELNFDDVSQPGTVATANLARIKWNRLMMYPRGVKSDLIKVSASMHYPTSWKYSTALPVAAESTGTVNFGEVNLTTLVDSPAIIGRYFVKVPLSGGEAPAEIDIAGETADSIKFKPETLAGWKNLITQANLAFGAHHYKSYKFLLTLSDNGGDEGLEHHESSEDGTGEKALTNELELLDLGDLLGHEYTHSWNGKYRRPASLTTPDFEQPMYGDLLWVYEGLTQYMGHVLPARSGLWTVEMFRESVAETYASMDTQTGRRWRPLVDTATAVQFTYSSPRAWMNERRRVDYYDEGSLVWLDADVLIRQKSGGTLSLDDFFHKFHGGQSGTPRVVTYDLNEIVRTLNSVLPYDWQTFFIDRVYNINKNAPMGGTTNGGWHLVFNDTPNLQDQVDFRNGGANLMYSIGIIVNNEGEVRDINPDLAAAKSGLAPGIVIKKVNGEDFSIENMRKAVAATKNGASEIILAAKNGSETGTYKLSYSGGEKYPHLERDASKPDYLSAIALPR